jgi:hypothetical protein
MEQRLSIRFSLFLSRLDLVSPIHIHMFVPLLGIKMANACVSTERSLTPKQWFGHIDILIPHETQ